MDERTSIFSLAGKNVLLTGATAGLGRRFATVLHDAGASVAMVARRRDRLESISKELPRCVGIPADLSRDDPADVYRRAVAELGRIDVLVNNAAVIAAGVRAEDETHEQIMEMINVNLLAPIGLAQSVFREMKERGDGVIINVTSVTAHAAIGRFPQASYSATKGGMLAITREWAAQWSRYGIRVNALAPGFIETEITESVINLPNVHEWILRNTLIPRHGTPEDFDGALLFLASDASRYVTGQSIIVDGGWTAH